MAGPGIGGEDLVEGWVFDDFVGVHGALDGFGNFREGDFFGAERFDGEEGDYKAQELIAALVCSVPFRYRAGDGKPSGPPAAATPANERGAP